MMCNAKQWEDEPVWCRGVCVFPFGCTRATRAWHHASNSTLFLLRNDSGDVTDLRISNELPKMVRNRCSRPTPIRGPFRVPWSSFTVMIHFGGWLEAPASHPPYHIIVKAYPFCTLLPLLDWDSSYKLRREEGGHRRLGAVVVGEPSEYVRGLSPPTPALDVIGRNTETLRG